jgi:hypothetical protein
MSGWTNWRKLADQKAWYDEHLDWDGPSCYELAIGGPRGGELKCVYVGETANEKARMTAYGMHGSHLSEIIGWHLRQGWCLHYRGRTAKSKKAAVKIQNALLDKCDYDWNLMRN